MFVDVYVHKGNTWEEKHRFDHAVYPCFSHHGRYLAIINKALDNTVLIFNLDDSLDTPEHEFEIETKGTLEGMSFCLSDCHLAIFTKPQGYAISPYDVHIMQLQDHKWVKKGHHTVREINSLEFSPTEHDQLVAGTLRNAKVLKMEMEPAEGAGQ